MWKTLALSQNWWLSYSCLKLLALRHKLQRRRMCRRGVVGRQGTKRLKSRRWW